MLMNFKIIATLISSSLLLSGVAAFFVNDLQTEEPSMQNISTSGISILDNDSHDHDSHVHDLTEEYFLAGEPSNSGNKAVQEKSSKAPAAEIQWGKMRWVPKFDNRKAKSLSSEQKNFLDTIIPQPYAKSNIKCVGLYYYYHERYIAKARAENTCLELQKIYPYLSYEIIFRETKVDRDKNVYIYSGRSISKGSVDLVARNYGEREDTVEGLQIKPIYLVPSDSVDLEKDIDGTIATYLDEGNAFMQSNLGKEFKIDRDSSGSYDIGFVKSTYTQDEIIAKSFEAVASLLDDSPIFDSTDPDNRNKLFMLFLESDTETKGYCGLARYGGIAWVSVTGGCSIPILGFESYTSFTWVHEAMHQLGVRHVAEPCDLMYSPPTGSKQVYCPAGKKRILDPENKYYVGSNIAGVNILAYDIWREPKSKVGN